jgi:hypothetical protein
LSEGAIEQSLLRAGDGIRDALAKLMRYARTSN